MAVFKIFSKCKKLFGLNTNPDRLKALGPLSPHGGVKERERQRECLGVRALIRINVYPTIRTKHTSESRLPRRMRKKSRCLPLFDGAFDVLTETCPRVSLKSLSFFLYSSLSPFLMVLTRERGYRSSEYFGRTLGGRRRWWQNGRRQQQLRLRRPRRLDSFDDCLRVAEQVPQFP